MQSILTTMNFVDSNEDCAHFSYITCGCGCQAKSKTFFFSSSLLESEKPLVLEYSESDEFNPIKVVYSMIEALESDFELVNIELEIVDIPEI